MRDDRGLDWIKMVEKGVDSRYILKVKFIEFTDRLDLGHKRKRRAKEVCSYFIIND